jgi:hypothetical protein
MVEAKLTVAMVALKDIAYRPSFDGKSSESFTALVALKTIEQLDSILKSTRETAPAQPVEEK